MLRKTAKTVLNSVSCASLALSSLPETSPEIRCGWQSGIGRLRSGVLVACGVTLLAGACASRWQAASTCHSVKRATALLPGRRCSAHRSASCWNCSASPFARPWSRWPARAWGLSSPRCRDGRGRSCAGSRHGSFHARVDRRRVPVMIERQGGQ